MRSSDVNSAPDLRSGATAATGESVAAQPEAASPAGGLRHEFGAMLQEVGDLLELQLALLRTEWRLCTASVKRLLLWTPVLLMLAFTLLLSLLVCVGWAVYALTASVAWGLTAAGVLQLLVLVVGAVSIKRALRDSSFPRTRAQLRSAAQAVKNLPGEIGS